MRKSGRGTTLVINRSECRQSAIGYGKLVQGNDIEIQSQSNNLPSYLSKQKSKMQENT